MSNESTSAKLQELFDLFQSDALTKEEYESLKAELLNDGSMPVAKGNDLSSQSSLQNVAKKSVYEERIKVDPLNIKLLHEYAKFLINNQLSKEAVSVLLKIQTINEEDAEAKKLLFEMYAKLGWFKDALESGEQLLKENPSDINFLEELVKISIKLKDSSKASFYYEKILEIQPSHAAALHNRAMTLLQEKKVEDAIKIFKRIFASGQADIITTVYTSIGDALEGDFTSAIKTLNPILKKKVENSTTINRGYLFLTYCLCQNNADKAEIYQMSSNIDFEILKREQLPIDENPRQIIAEYLFNSKLQEVNPAKNPQSQIAEAIDFYLNYGGIPQKDKTKIAQAWYLVGMKHVELKLLADSLASLQKALDFVPDDTRFIEKCAELKKLIALYNKRRERKKLLVFVSSIAIIISTIAIPIFIGKYKDNKAYESAKLANTENSYKSYIENYPEGNHLNEVKELEENVYWNRTKKINTSDAYHTYLFVHFTGKHASEASDSLSSLKKPKIKKTKSETKPEKEAVHSAEEEPATKADLVIKNDNSKDSMIHNEYAYQRNEFILDREGNLYKTVKIGTQVWMAENLRVTSFRNGEKIPTTNPSELDISNESNPKYQWSYNGQDNLAKTHGRLYTWYVITDSRNICPTNWHVATDNEWRKIGNYLGGLIKAGGKLKESYYTHWQEPNVGATNLCGFNALPSGAREKNSFNVMGSNTYYWSPQEVDSKTGLHWRLSKSHAELQMSTAEKSIGYSIRCVRDN